MSQETLEKAIAEVSALLEERLRITGPTLAAQVGKLGRRVPRRVRQEAAYLARSEALCRHPKLSQMIDARQVARARRVVVAHLDGIDPRELRKDRILIALAKVSALLILLTVGAIWLAWARGLI